MKKTFLPLAISLIFAGVWIVLGGLLYNALLGTLWTPLLVAIYITGLAGVLLLAAIVSNSLCMNAKPKSNQYQKAGIVIAAIFLCSMLFEFLYELDSMNLNFGKPTSYVFLIDNSGSMDWNDPDCVRNDAIHEILKECEDDFPYAVYGFDHTCEQISSIEKASNDQLTTNYGTGFGGGTDIMLAINRVLDDIKSGALKGVGNSPRIILLSDGDSDDYGYRNTIDNCLKNGVSISTVSLGDETNEMLLKNIANDTHGTFVEVKDIGQLKNAMSSAATFNTNYDRNLLNTRGGTARDSILHAILRPAFFLILAAGFVLIKAFVFSTFDENNIALITFIVFAVFGAIAPEIGMNVLGIYEPYVRAILCGCFMLLLGSGKEPVDPNMGNVKNAWNNPYNTGMGGGFAGASDKWKF